MATDKLVDFDHVTDYISRDAALACFHDWIDRYGHEHTADEMVEYQRIEELPVADARPVVKCEDCGNAFRDNQGNIVHCDLNGKCDTGYVWCKPDAKCRRLDFYCKNFCPNCGADMRGPNLDTTKGDIHD